MPKCLQTRGKVAIHLVDAELQYIWLAVSSSGSPCAKTHRLTQTKGLTLPKPTRPLLYTCRSTGKQGLSSQSILSMRNPNKAVSFIQPCRPFQPAMCPCAKWTKTYFRLQTKRQTLLKPIQTSSIYMPKCPQTRTELPIHLVHEELQ
jgi:hypothetical protein